MTQLGKGQRAYTNAFPGKQLKVGGRSRTQPSEVGKEQLLGTGRGDIAKAGQAAGFPLGYSSLGRFVPLLALEAPEGDAVSQYCTVLLQGTGSAHIPPADLNGNCFAG